MSCNEVTYCRFSNAGTWELVNLFVGTKKISYHICYEKMGRKMSSCVGLVYFQSLVGLRLLLVIYLMN